jgi:hypothetical protein
MKRIPLHVAAWFLCALLAGCKVLGLEPVPQSFDGRLSAAYTLNTAIRDASTNSLASGAISSTDAEDWQKRNREFRARLDQLKTVAGTDLSTAEARLTALETALQALRSELLKKGVQVQP